MSQRSGQTAGGIVVLTVLPSSVLCIVGPAYEGVIPTRVAYVWEVVGVSPTTSLDGSSSKQSAVCQDL